LTGRADGRERRAAFEDDAWNVGQGLDVVDDGQLAEEAGVHGERRLVARLAALPFDRLEECGFLAARSSASSQLAGRKAPRSRTSGCDSRS
jgi:hypothetical protein